MLKKKIRFTLFILIGFALMLAVFQSYHYVFRPSKLKPQVQISSFAQISEKHNLGMPQVGGHFQLHDLQGNIITDKSFPGKFLLIYFGYSFCPDICPAALVNISDALRALGRLADKMEVLFISLDPERDTSETLRNYMTSFHKKIRALTGTPAEIQKAAHAYKVFYRKVKSQEHTDYVVDHSSIIYLMNPQGVLIRHFNHETPVQTLIQEIKTALHS